MYGRRSLLYGSEALLDPIKAVAQSRDVFFYLAKDDCDFSLPAHQLLQSARYQFRHILSHSGLPLLADDAGSSIARISSKIARSFLRVRGLLGSLPLTSLPIGEALALPRSARLARAASEMPRAL